MIIGISGKAGVGKDTLVQVIQYCIDISRCIKESPNWEKDHETTAFTERDYKDWLHAGYDESEYNEWKVVRFADKLKDIVCMLLGCTREQLEDREFKEKELGEEWWHYLHHSTSLGGRGEDIRFCNSIISYPDQKAEDLMKLNHPNRKYVTLLKLTPRSLLQLLGTECGREIIHPNIWVNATMKGYVPEPCSYLKDRNGVRLGLEKLSNWLMPDVRFINEAEAIKSRDGIVIRVNAPLKQYDRTCMDCFKQFDFKDAYYPNPKKLKDFYCPKCHSGRVAGVLVEPSTHRSETELDDYPDFDYVINHKREFLPVITQTRKILQELKII